MDIGNECTTTESVKLKKSDSPEFQIHGCVGNVLLIYNDVFKCSKIDHRRIKKLHSNLSKKTGDVMFVGCRAVRDVNGPSERTQ